MNSRLNRPPMGIATEKSYSNKKYYAKFFDVFNSGSIASIESACLGIFAEDADIHASHPINQACSENGYFKDIIAPISQSLEGLCRQNYIVLAGEYFDTQ